MFEAALLAGFLSAHAIWSVSDGETLIPIYGYINENNERVMERLDHDRLEVGVAAGQEKLRSNPHKTDSAVLVYDGRITLQSGKLDALIVEFRNYSENGGVVRVALPYSPANDSSKFAVHRPKVIGMSEHIQDDIQSILSKFFEGVDQHEMGSAIWNQHLDESI